MPAVDFWDHPPDPPSAASVDGVASPAPRVVLVPVDDSDHAQRAVAWAVDNLLRGGDGGDVAHLLHVVPAVHAATAMAYGGPPVWMEDLSTFSKSLYAVTAIPPAAISYPPRSLLGRFFSDALVVALSFATKNALTDAHPPAGSQPYHASMAVPGPTFWQQIEADERARHAEDRRAAEAFIENRFVPLLSKRRVKYVVDVTRGDTNNWSVGEIVCNHAKMLRASCVVMASHGKGRVKEFFVGSVCNHCLHRCEAPLVLVRPECADANGKAARGKETKETSAGKSTAEGATQTVDAGDAETKGERGEGGGEAAGVSA